MEERRNQCRVLVVNAGDSPFLHRAAFDRLGFRVTETRDWPEDERAVLDHHVVIVRIRSVSGAPMVGARLRAKPHFGRRVLIALVPSSASLQERLEARASGFDEVLNIECDPRQLSARILRRLRTRPEYHCVLPPDDRRRRAA